MDLFSHFFSRKKMSLVSQLIDKVGFEDASIFCYGLITAKLANTNTHIMLAQMSQFIREEFDAASQGNSYSRAFVQKQCLDSSWYRGAMQETPEYPIDETGGPQQAILALTNPIVSENPDLAVKFRCHIVGMVNFHSKCKILGGVAEFFSKAFLCRFPPENFPRPVVYPVHSLPV